MATLIDGKKVAASIREEVKAEVAQTKGTGYRSETIRGAGRG